MRTDDASPLYTPSSPLSPILNPSVSPVSPYLTARSLHKNAGLKLTNLGRFPPSPSNTSNMPKHDTPTSSAKRHGHGHARQYSEAQKALHIYQRELIASATRSSRSVSTSTVQKPLSPKLIPLGSPGPVTPFMLEEDDGGYLVAGAVTQGTVHGENDRRELVERLIREEADRRNSPQAGRDSPVSPAGG